VLDKKTTLTVICPVFNESEVIEKFYSELTNVLLTLSQDLNYNILFVVDKSTDNTVEILSKIAKLDSKVQLIILSARFGHQMSLVAGLDNSDSDMILMMDSDLQHPPALIPSLIEEYKKGYDVVYTIRDEPKDSNPIKRLGSNLFYKIMSWLAEVTLQPGQADYRLISRKVAEVFRHQIRERNQFLRGLFSWVGFKTTHITFKPLARTHGESKYDFKRMYNFAFQGITSFSKKPLQYAMFLGLTLSFIAFLQILYVVFHFFYSETVVSGFATITILISFFGGLQLIFLGIIGEYIGSIFDEVKARPLYIVEKTINIELEL